MSLKRKQIYLDSNAGTPLHPKVHEEFRRFFSGDHVQSTTGSQSRNATYPNQNTLLIANPSSIHAHGRASRALLSQAKESIASSFGSDIDSEEITFTSSGTEANQMVIRSQLSRALKAQESPVWITTSVEHDATHQMIEWFENQGGRVEILPVNHQGELLDSLETLSKKITKDVALMSLIWVNNETGVITDIDQVRSAIEASENPEVYLHLDGAQAWGKIDLNLKSTRADLVSFSSHKIGAPAGVGVVWLRPRRKLDALILGKQEKGRRGGTENLLGIHALGIAAAAIDVEKSNRSVIEWRDRFEKKILEVILDAEVNGLGANRVANTTNLTFRGISGESLVLALDLAGFSVSSGSACSSGTLEPSHVLMAMGRDRSEAMASIRVSWCPWLVEAQDPKEVSEEIESFVNSLQKSVKRMKDVSIESKNRRHYEYEFKRD